MKGFSIIELVVVIGVLGVLAVSAIVLTPAISLMRLDAAGKQIVSDIMFARQNAMSTQQTSGVSFTNGGSYTVYQGTTATPLLDPLTQQSMIKTIGSSYTGISLTKSYVVEFNSIGSPTTGGGGNVTLSDGTTTRTVTVIANTGKVTVQ